MDEPTGGQFNGNLVSLHTGNECTLNTAHQTQTGITSWTNCTVDYAAGNDGCRIEMNQTTPLNSKTVIPTTGPALNKAQGGLFAMERDLSTNGTGIRVWYFPHSQVPDNLKAGSQRIDTSSWGTPAADFPVSSCASNFGNMSIVFDITLCVYWASNTYNVSGCNKSFPSCAFQVGQNGSSYSEAYWAVSDVRAFVNTGSGSSGSSGSSGAKSGKKGAASLVRTGTLAVIISVVGLGVSLLL